MTKTRFIWKDVLAAVLLACAVAGYWTVNVGLYDDAAVTQSVATPPFVHERPGEGFGMPQDHEPVSSLMYPPRLVHLALPAHVATRVLIAAHLWAAGLFMYMLLRVLRTGRPAAFCGGATFMLSGAVLSASLDPPALYTLCYAPLAVALVHQTLTRSGLHWPVLTGLVGAVQLLAGYPQIALYTMYLACAYAASEIAAECVATRDWRPLRPAIGKLCLAACTAACVAAPLFLLWLGWRVAGGATATRIASAIARAGRTDLPFGSMIGTALDPERAVGLRYQYTGLATLVLAVAALCSAQHRRRMLTIGCVGAAALVMSTGAHSILYRVYSHVPAEKLFAAPHRLFVLWTIAVAVLCGVGLDYFERSRQVAWSHRRRIEVGILCGAALLLALFVKPVGQRYILILILGACAMFTVTTRAMRVAAELGVIGIVLFDLTHAAAFRAPSSTGQTDFTVEARVEAAVTAPLPRARVVGRYEVVENPQEVLARLESDEFDPRSTVLLTEQPTTANNEPTAAEIVRATVKEVSVGHTVVTTPELAGPGLLVLTDTFYPGTHTVFVDGNESSLLRANGIFRAVFLEPGAHIVRFEHRLAGWRIGRWISLAALSILFAAGIVQWVMAARGPQAGEADSGAGPAAVV